MNEFFISIVVIAKKIGKQVILIKAIVEVIA
jgi:hypothetical protein